MGATQSPQGTPCERERTHVHVAAAEEGQDASLLRTLSPTRTQLRHQRVQETGCYSLSKLVCPADIPYLRRF